MDDVPNRVQELGELSPSPLILLVLDMRLRWFCGLGGGMTEVVLVRDMV